MNIHLPHQADGNEDLVVLLPFFNAGDTLSQSIESVLDQSYSNFKLVIIDDGSTVETTINAQFMCDPRVHLVRNETNLGLAKSLNKAMGMFPAKIYARIDSDDWAEYNRFEIQMDFLRSYPELDIVGTGVIFHDHNSVEVGKVFYPQYHWHISLSLPFTCPLAHPTLMFRSRIIDLLGGYDEGLRYAQDYDLYRRAIHSKIKLHNIPIALVHMRLHKKINVAKVLYQMKVANMIGADSMRTLIFRVRPSLDFKFDHWIPREAEVRAIENLYDTSSGVKRYFAILLALSISPTYMFYYFRDFIYYKIIRKFIIRHKEY